MPPNAGETLEQIADRAGLAVGRLVGRRGEIGEAEAELLVLGADAELLRRLAAGRDIVGQLLHRRDRRRVGVSGIGHVAPRRGGFAFMVLAAVHPLQQCQPGDAGGLGPQDARAERYRRLQRDARAARQAPPARSRLPDRPAVPRAPCGRRTGAAACAAFDRGEQAPVAAASRTAVPRAAAADAGRARSGARTARRPRWRWRAGDPRFIRCALPRSVSTGSSAATPSSVAFCTTRSVASRFSSANTSHRSGSGACGAAVRSRRAEWRGRAGQSRCGRRIRRRGR